MRTESGPTMAPQIMMMMMMMNSSSAESSSPSGGGGGGGGEEEERWRHFDNSVNAVSFGFVATAILISMFLVMAIFERFLRPPTSPSSSSSSSSQGIINDQVGRRRRRRGGSSSPSFAFAAAFDLESQHHHRNFAPKLDYPSSSPKMSIYAKGVSVLMPGNDIPTYIAHPAPAPCPPERILWPPHDHNYFPIVGSTSS